jgi:hypothetical protein
MLQLLQVPLWAACGGTRMPGGKNASSSDHCCTLDAECSYVNEQFWHCEPTEPGDSSGVNQNSAYTPTAAEETERDILLAAKASWGNTPAMDLWTDSEWPCDNTSGSWWQVVCTDKRTTAL